MIQKVLIFTTAYRPMVGGSELAIEETVKRLPEFFFEIIAPRFRKDFLAEERGLNFVIHRVGFGRTIDKFLFPVTGFLYSRKFFPPKADQPSSEKNKGKIIIHAYQASYGAGAAWLAKIFFPKNKFILTLQEGKDLKKQGLLIRFFRRLIIKKADYATALSNYLREYALGINKHLNVAIIPNGVDLPAFSKKFSYGETTDLENKLGIKPDDRVIISISRLVPKNGIDLLVKALAVLKKSGQFSYRLILAGDGPQKSELQSLVKELGVEDRVIFAGMVDYLNLPLYLAVSDVFVRPSRSEGLGSAFLEAMAAGVPIIAPRIGGIPDFLDDRKTGLFSTLEPEDIAFKIRIILENDKLKEEIINNARALVGEKYDWNKIADEFSKLYSKL